MKNRYETGINSIIIEYIVMGICSGNAAGGTPVISILAFLRTRILAINACKFHVIMIFCSHRNNFENKFQQISLEELFLLYNTLIADP